MVTVVAVRQRTVRPLKPASVRLWHTRRNQTDGAIILSMIDWSSCQAVEQAPERYSGAWVFRGTRVPVTALFENLEGDASIHEFVEWFPGVTCLCKIFI